MPAPELLLDTASLFYRAFFALPASIRDPSGQAVNAVRGYLDMTSRLRTDRGARGVVHCQDRDWRPAPRVAAYPGYKSERRPDPPEMPAQVEILARVLAAAGECVAGIDGWEADDVIAVLAGDATPEAPVEIVTGDRDLIALVRDPAVTVLFTVRGVSELRRFDAATVRERYGVEPAQYGDMAMLRGDPSDGLPGVRGVGEKSATALVARYGSIDGVEEWAATAQGRSADAIRSARDYLAAMRHVVRAPAGMRVDRRPAGSVDREALAELARRHSLEGPVSRLLAARGEEPLPGIESS